MYLKRGSPIPEKGKGARLTGKRLRFVEAYMADPEMRSVQAVLKAGYITKKPDAMAGQLLAHPLIQREIQTRLDRRRDKMELSAEYVLAKLRKIVEDTEDDNPQAALRGLELLGKHLGLYRDRQEISGPDGGAIEMQQRVKEDVSDFQSKLDRLIESGGKAGDTVVPITRGSRSS